MCSLTHGLPRYVQDLSIRQLAPSSIYVACAAPAAQLCCISGRQCLTSALLNKRAASSLPHTVAHDARICTGTARGPGSHSGTQEGPGAHAARAQACTLRSMQANHARLRRDNEAAWEPFRHAKEGLEPIRHMRKHAQSAWGQYRIVLHKMLVSYWRNPEVSLGQVSAEVRPRQVHARPAVTVQVPKFSCAPHACQRCSEQTSNPEARSSAHGRAFSAALSPQNAACSAAGSCYRNTHVMSEPGMP